KTPLHRFHEDGESHFANVDDIQIPADLEPLLYTVRGLNDFRMQSHARLKPLVNLTDGSHFVGPGDIATIYDINLLYQKGINGSGQKIAVAGQSAFKMSDVQTFRSTFGLPKNDPKLVLVPGYPEAAINDDVGEAILDVEYAGASAPNATILYVY